jgi:phosphoadenosine phosphosulfate reductase
MNPRIAQTLNTLRTASELSSKAAVVLAHSLSAEDMVLTDLIQRERLPIGFFCLNTGRLHAETLATLARVEAHYAITIAQLEPVATVLQDFSQREGNFPMYESIELRKACCAIRKTEPLKRALVGKAAWVTGLRREQSVTRVDLAAHEWDSAHGLDKFNPLLEWSQAEVWAYLTEYKVPTNPLHQRGYPSIGCEPCTRAINPGEDQRAGRWWWEDAGQKECGLHLKESSHVSA